MLVAISHSSKNQFLYAWEKSDPKMKSHGVDTTIVPEYQIIFFELFSSGGVSVKILPATIHKLDTSYSTKDGIFFSGSGVWRSIKNTILISGKSIDRKSNLQVEPFEIEFSVNHGQTTLIETKGVPRIEIRCKMRSISESTYNAWMRKWGYSSSP
jgi:hypothetical protein